MNTEEQWESCEEITEEDMASCHNEDDEYDMMREEEHNMLEETVGDMINAFVKSKDKGYYKGCPEKFAEHVIGMLQHSLNIKVRVDEYNIISCRQNRLDVKCNKCGWITDTSKGFKDIINNGHIVCNKCNDGDLKPIKYVMLNI